MQCNMRTKMTTSPWYVHAIASNVDRHAHATDLHLPGYQAALVTVAVAVAVAVTVVVVVVAAVECR